ncbi:MAG TPA: tetratricopeptide repeat protein [Fimbriiglobus sp.]|nr:tetratricopeptide repeat protein [Fimbriiglobus sp.]
MTFRASLLIALTAPAFAQQPMPPDKQAEVALAAGQRAYNDGQLAAAAQKFQEVVQKFGGTPSANAARYGLALCLINSPEQDFAKAIEHLAGPAGDGGFADRWLAAYQLAVCHRALGLKEVEKATSDEERKKSEPRFAEAARWFTTARDGFAGKKDDERAARCRCDLAEMLLRQNKVKEARAACEPFAKDDALAKNRHRPLGLYYHGLACFLDRDPNAAGRSLNQLAPFADPAFGAHARYLVGRVLHLSGETAEASFHYDGVLTDHEKQKKDAAQALTQPDKFKNNPFEKARLEALAQGPPPEYVAAAAFHGACLHYEAGRFAEALPKFQAFGKEYAGSPLQPDAALRAGFCLVQLRQFDEAAKLLAPLAEKTPRLADQALFWLGKAQLGTAQAADPNNPADRDAKLKTAIDTLQRAADRAGQSPNDPDAKGRRAEMRFDLADALQIAKRFKDAAAVYEQLWNETALPGRREELLQRLAAALGAAGELDRSNQRCDEFRRAFPESVLMPAVYYRQAENAHSLATRPGTSAEDRQRRLEDAAAKYQEVTAKFPEFERASFARFGAGVCLAQLGKLDEAVAALEAIPAPDRAGELAAAGYLLADCLIRQAPAKAEDALQENIVREKLTAAAQLLEGFVAASPKAAEAPAALLKLGHCTKRLGATLADPNERNQTLNRAREVYERLAREYPKDPLAGQARLDQAKVKALLGDRGGAMNDLRQFAQNGELQKAPEAPLAALHLATLHRDQNQPAEAAKVLDDARKRYEPALAKDQQRADWVPLLKYHHAVAIFEAGKPADARPLFDQAAGEAKGKPLGAEAALRGGQCRLAEARAKVEAARKAKEQAGNDAGKVNAANQATAAARGAVLEAANGLMRRAAEFRAALPTAEPRARMLYDAAWAYRGLADGQAHAAYRRLIEEFPDAALAVDARFELAEMLTDGGDAGEAVKLLREALDKEPSDRPVSPETTERIRLRLGASLHAAKDYAAAASQFEAVAGNDKSSHRPQALYRAGESLLAAGEFAKAVEKLAVFRDKGEFHNVGGVSDRAVLRLGQALAGAKEWDKSRQAFEVFLQRYGSSPFAAEARYGIGWAFQQQGKFDDAVKSYEQVIAATTAEAAAKAQLGVGQCRLAQKKPAEAAAAFLVVPYTYDYPELGYAALLEAARAFAEAKQPEQAEKMLRKVLKDAPKDSEWAKAARERLEKVK